MFYNEIVADLSKIPDFISYYEGQIQESKREIKLFGSIEKNVAALPGLVEYRFNQLQEIEAVLNYLNIQLRKIRRKHFQKYLEAYARALTSRDAERYTDGEQEVIDFEMIINEVALVRNKYLAVMKGLEQKSFMLGHITRLKVAGMEDYSV